MSRYSPKIAEMSARPKCTGLDQNADGFGADADLGCGSVVRFSVRLGDDSSGISAVRFNSNGCAYMVAAADALCFELSGRHLDSLGGLGEADLARTLAASIGTIPDDRRHCVSTCISAVRKAFANCRERRVAAFNGEDALICTCFGVGETAIRNVIESGHADSVAGVTAACNAGGGCGSCRMLIQELIDTVTEPI